MNNETRQRIQKIELILSQQSDLLRRLIDETNNNTSCIKQINKTVDEINVEIQILKDGGNI